MAQFRQNIYYGNAYQDAAEYRVGDQVVFGTQYFTALQAQASATQPPTAGVSNDFWTFVGTVPQRGYYQYETFDNMLNNFMFEKTGEDTLLGKINRNKVAYHLQRSVQMLNYDVLRVTRSLNVEMNQTTRSVVIPQDLVNIVGIYYVDTNGNKHPVHSQSNVSAGQEYMQNDQFEYIFTDDGDLIEQSQTTSQQNFQNPNSQQDFYATSSYVFGSGFNDFEQPYAGGYFKRYGLNPEFAQGNGFYNFDENKGIIYFSEGFASADAANMTIDYISDGLAEDGEIRVNKLAEEAMYKMTEYKILSNKSKEAAPDYIIRRVKKEADVEVRNAKIRFMDLNMNELAQHLRQQSVWIKH